MRFVAKPETPGGYVQLEIPTKDGKTAILALKVGTKVDASTMEFIADTMNRCLLRSAKLGRVE